MLKKSITLFAILVAFITGLSLAQPTTDIYLLDLKKDGMDYEFSNPVNISQNEGYDNQPYFLPSGEGVLYSSERNGQTDIALYHIGLDSTEWITDTPGSEYSPTVTPDGNYISTIILEEDGTQLLWKYPIAGGEPMLVAKDLVIGYHTWFDNETLYSFVLGDPPTLHEVGVSDKEQTDSVIVQNPGRSLHSIPNTDKISFINFSDTTRPMIQSYQPLSKQTDNIIPPVENSRDMTWTPSGTILMGRGSMLFAYNPSAGTGWYEVADLSKFGLNGITRIDIGPDEEKIAIVVEE